MERTTLSLPEDLRKRLRVVAAEQGTSMATLIREALAYTVEDLTTGDYARARAICDATPNTTSVLCTPIREAVQAST
jgi:predicted DNA-binding protein